jgi:predicted outer membrane protein
MRRFDMDRGMRAASNILRHRHHATLLAAAVIALISVAFLGTSQVLAQTAVDRAFLAWAVQIEIQQQDMGRIAERRAQAAAVREFGGYLVLRHRQGQLRLEIVANHLGVALSSKLSATHLRVQSRFRSIPSASFDKAFIRHEVGDYRYFLQHFETASRTGGPLVRQYATSEVENLKEDQAKIAALAAGAT